MHKKLSLLSLQLKTLKGSMTLPSMPEEKT